jgi:hypothetical protein
MSTALAEAPVSTDTPTKVEEQVPLAERYNTIREQRTKERAKPEPANEAEAVKTDKEPEKAKDEKVEAKADTKAEKPKNALEAVLSDTKKPEATQEQAEAEIPANAPAKLLREAMERHKSEAIKWKAEAEKVKGGDPATKTKLETIERERESLKAENQKLRDAITAINVEYDPAVQEKFVAGKAKLVDKTVKAVEEYGGDAKAFEAALKLPPGQRTAAMKAALESVDELDRQPIYDKLNKIRELEEEHADLVANSQQSYENLTKAQQERALAQQEQTEKQKNAIAEKVLGSLSTKHPLFLEAPAEAEGASDYNARLKADMEKAAHLRGPDADWNEISEASAKAARYDFLEETHLEFRESTQAEIAQLKEQLAKYESADTGFTGGKKPVAQDPSTLTPGQRYMQGMQRRREAASA